MLPAGRIHCGNWYPLLAPRRLAEGAIDDGQLNAPSFMESLVVNRAHCDVLLSHSPLSSELRSVFRNTSSRLSRLVSAPPQLESAAAALPRSAPHATKEKHRIDVRHTDSHARVARSWTLTTTRELSHVSHLLHEAAELSSSCCGAHLALGNNSRPAGKCWRGSRRCPRRRPLHPRYLRNARCEET
jgi:hypothetical protein